MKSRTSFALRAAAVVAAAGLAVGLASCSSDSGGGTASDAPSGGIAQIASTIDPIPQSVIAPRLANLMWRQLVFEELVSLDPETLQPKPFLATSWELSPDQKTLTLELRDDVTFHTGRAMDSSDVVFSLQQAMLPENGVQLLRVAQQFTDITAPSATEVKITFATPLPTVFDLLDQVPIIDKETWAQVKDGTKVVGTGPFMWSSWTPGGSLTLDKYAGYRDADSVKLDGVQLSVITDSTAQIAALKSGRTQLGYGLTVTDALGFQNNPDFTLDTATTINQMMGLNSAAPSLSDQKVRQAIYYAIDRDRINKQLFGGTGVVTDLAWSTADPGYNEDQATQYHFDPDKAKQLLQQAGSPNVSFTMTVPAYPIQQSMFEIIQNNLQAVGISVEANVVDSATFNKMKSDNNTGEAFLDLNPVLSSAANTVDNLNALRPTGNLTGLGSPEYLALADRLRTAPAGNEQKDAVEAMSEYLLDQAVLQTIVRSPTLLPRNLQLQNTAYNFQGYLLLNNAYLQK